MSAEQIIYTIVAVGGGAAALAAVLYTLKRASDWLGARTQNEKIVLLYRRIDDVAERVVKEIYQAYVTPLQAKGQWDQNAANTAREQAIAKLKSYIGYDGIKLLEYIAGANGTKSLDEFLGTYVEAQVHDLKAGLDTVAAMVQPALPLPRGASPVGNPAATVSKGPTANPT